MNGIIIERYWQEEELLCLKVSAENEFLNIFQYCYIGREQLSERANKILKFISDFDESIFISFGTITGRYMPAFSMNLSVKSLRGIVQIELDMEVDDNADRKHRCQFYLNTELGLLEKFGKGLLAMSINDNVMSTNLERIL